MILVAFDLTATLEDSRNCPRSVRSRRALLIARHATHIKNNRRSASQSFGEAGQLPPPFVVISTRSCRGPALEALPLQKPIGRHSIQPPDVNDRASRRGTTEHVFDFFATGDDSRGSSAYESWSRYLGARTKLLRRTAVGWQSLEGTASHAPRRVHSRLTSDRVPDERGDAMRADTDWLFHSTSIVGGTLLTRTSTSSRPTSRTD
jgi:hypothetical protein